MVAFLSPDKKLVKNQHSINMELKGKYLDLNRKSSKKELRK